MKFLRGDNVQLRLPCLFGSAYSLLDPMLYAVSPWRWPSLRFLGRLYLEPPLQRMREERLHANILNTRSIGFDRLANTDIMDL